MAMTHVTEYAMARFNRGVCFRLSFKWAALSLLGGDFNFELDSAGLNVSSTISKHVAYRKVSAAKENNPSSDFTNQSQFDSYVAEDGRQAAEYINKWGVRFKGSKAAGGQIYNGVTVRVNVALKLTRYFSQDASAAGRSLIYGFYGLENAKPAGHAVAFSKGQFFDANSGVWHCDPANSAGDDIDDYVAQYYNWPATKFVIFVLEGQASNGVVSSGCGCTLF